MIWILASGLSLLIWAYLLVARGGFWREFARPERSAARRYESVVALVPARNEAAAVGQAIESLIRQGCRVILVDDHSSDGTADEARRAGTRSDLLTVVEAAPLPSGWTGKLWAISEGLRHASALSPDYLLFTDADIVHAPDSIASLVARSEREDLDLASYMVRLQCSSLAERVAIPAFVFFFFMLYPPRWIANTAKRTAGAAGGCILIRTEALERIGGIASIRNELIDDCALARKVKESGGRIWLGTTPDTRSIRDYTTFGEVERMISRTAFTQLNHSGLLLIGTALGLGVTYIMPVAALFSGNVIAIVLGAAAWFSMTIAFFPAVRFYRQSWVWACALPLIALFYAGATLHSAADYWRGRGGQWKGRIQDEKSPTTAGSARP